MFELRIGVAKMRASLHQYLPGMFRILSFFFYEINLIDIIDPQLQTKRELLRKFCKATINHVFR